MLDRALADCIALDGKDSLAYSLREYLEGFNGVVYFPEIGRDVHPSAESASLFSCSGVLLDEIGRKPLGGIFLCSIEVRCCFQLGGRGSRRQSVGCRKVDSNFFIKVDSVR